MIVKPLLRCVTPKLCNLRLIASNPPRMITDRIVWIDLEMTGLDPEKDKIMEIACAITDFSLKDVIKGPDIVIKIPEDDLKKMDEWCTKQHGMTGLTDLCRNSSITLPQAEESVLQFVKEHVEEDRAPLGGNSVYMDRIFLRKYMPRLNQYLHYRIIDVTSIREVFKRWAPLIAKNAPEKRHAHRASDDILDSINELRYYGKSVFELP